MLKRLMDIFGALVALILFSPIMAFTAWKVARTMGKPVFFRQLRPGFGGKPFEMVKFRTMINANRPDGKPLPDAERITPFGCFMRRARRLSENSSRSEDGRKLRIKIPFCEVNSGAICRTKRNF